MAKGKQYYFTHSSVSGKSVELEIWSEGYIGDPTPMQIYADSLILEYGEKEPIRSPVLTFDAKTTSIRQFEELYNTPPMDVSVRMYIDGNKEFDGYLSNEVYNEVKSNRSFWKTRMTAHTGIKWLREIKAFDNSLFSVSDYKTILEVLWDALATRVSFSSIVVRAAITDSADNAVAGTTLLTFLKKYIRGKSLELANRDSVTLYDFIHDMMVEFDCELYKQGDIVHIIRSAEKYNATESSTYRMMTYTSKTSVGTRSDIIYGDPYDFSDLANMYVYDTGVSLTKTNGIKVFEITEDLAKIENFISDTLLPAATIEDAFTPTETNFNAQIEAAGMYEWLVKGDTNSEPYKAFDFDEADYIAHFSNLNTTTNFGYIQDKINNCLYTKGVFYLGSNTRDRSITVSYKIKANTTRADLNAGVWLAIRPRNGGVNWEKWRNVYVSQYSENSGKTCIKELDISTPASYYPRPVPTSKAIDYPDDGFGNNDLVINDGFIDVSITFNLTDLNDVTTFGLNVNGTTANIPSGVVEFAVGFLPMTKFRDSLSDNLMGGAQYAESECWIKDMTVAINQNADPEVDRGNASEYSVNTEYFGREGIDIKYPSSLNINYQYAIMSDQNYSPILGWDDPVFSVNDAPLEDLNAMWRMQYFNKPRSNVSMLIRSKSDIIRLNNIFTPTFISDKVFYVDSLKHDVMNDDYKIELNEFIMDDGVTLP
jgi:hypothetical protein